MRAAAVSQRLPEALLFDCDGVLVDTERDGHRVAFNQTFDEEFGPGKHVWDVELYGELLKIGGGKERMMAYFSSKESEEPFASLKTDEERKEFLLKMHLRKTAIFMEVLNITRIFNLFVSRVISTMVFTSYVFDLSCALKSN